jgi:hypothetical protein
MCLGDWVFQLDADEVVDDNFDRIRASLIEARSETVCFTVLRADYAPDLYHAFLPYTAHHPIPRIWRKGSVDWMTGKELHMEPYLAGTRKGISSFGTPTLARTDQVLHHVHRAYWIGKSKHKQRSPAARPLKRTSPMGSYKWAIDVAPDDMMPTTLKTLRSRQKTILANRLGVPDDFENAAPGEIPEDRPDLALSSKISALPNPILFVELGSRLDASTRFLAGEAGGCVVAIVGRQPADLYSQALSRCWQYRERILPVCMAPKEALRLPLADIDLLYIHQDCRGDLPDWAPRLAGHGLLCGPASDAPR